MGFAILVVCDELQYGEPGFSDYGIKDIATKLDLPVSVVRGALENLYELGLIWSEDVDTDNWSTDACIHMTSEGYYAIGSYEKGNIYREVNL